MFYYIAQNLYSHYSILNVIRYVSVRSICALLSALILSFVFGEKFIRQSQKNFRSKVREETPKTHKIKDNTPTMGGLFILSIFSINMLMWANLEKMDVWLFLLCLLGFGAIGFIDDLAKIKHRKGISAKLKFSMQVVMSMTIMSLWYFICSPNTKLCVPFFKNITPELGWFIIPWGAFVIIATSNAVNLTDGLDGLATGPLIFNFSSIAIICYLAGHKEFAKYLLIPFAHSAEITVLGTTLIGALLGFLWYNTYPAQIFMGDVGSLALGSGLAFMAIMARQELLIPLAGGIFFIETISVVAQVISFRLWKKRIFKMAPIHHHFELLGWSEPKITVRFWIISIVLSLISLLTLKIR